MNPSSPRPFVLDTNILMFAISNGVEEGPDNNSALDRSTRIRKISPERVRGALIVLLAENPVIIPEVVVRELCSKKTQDKMSQKNKENLKLILSAVANRQMPFVAQRIEIIRQNIVFNKIGIKAEGIAQNLRKQGFDIPKNWVELLSPKISENLPPLDELAKHQACLTWAKIHEDAPQVLKNIHNLPMDGETKQRIYLAQAKEISERLDKPETTVQEMNQLVKKQALLELEAEKEKPFLLPDLEILFLAQRNGAPIYTLDNDLELFQTEISEKRKVPTLQTTTGPWSSIEALAQALKKNLNRQFSEQQAQAQKHKHHHGNPEII